MLFENFPIIKHVILQCFSFLYSHEKMIWKNWKRVIAVDLYNVFVGVFFFSYCYSFTSDGWANDKYSINVEDCMRLYYFSVTIIFVWFRRLSSVKQPYKSFVKPRPDHRHYYNIIIFYYLDYYLLYYLYYYFFFFRSTRTSCSKLYIPLTNKFKHKNISILNTTTSYDITKKKSLGTRTFFKTNW